MQKTILFPLPDRDFDVTEVAVPWKLLTEAGHRVIFATEDGAAPSADPLLLGGLPFGLGAKPEPTAYYRELEQSKERNQPLCWRDIDPPAVDALFLAGGHAPGMRQYLGSEVLRAKVVDIWRLGHPVAAICHGVLVAARAVDPRTGRSILRDRLTTCLPKYMERSAYFLTAWKLGKYYRTYPAYVEDEVRAALASREQFQRGPRSLVARGDRTNDAPAFVVEDRGYLSARWPGDAYLIAKRLDAALTDAPRTAIAGEARA